MRLSRLLFCAALAGLISQAQRPIAVSQVGIDGGNTGTQIDYDAIVGGSPGGDTYYFMGWGSNSIFSGSNGFPDQSGLPIIGTWNDGSTSAPDPNCAGNVGLVQLSKLPPLGTTATIGNTLIRGWANCMSTYSAGDIHTAPNGTWNDGYSWKGAVLNINGGIIYLPFFRQLNSGGIPSFGDSSMVLSLDYGSTFVDYGRWKSYTVTASSCAAGTANLTLSSLTSAGGETLATSSIVYVHDVGTGYNGKATLLSASAGHITYAATCPGTTPSSGWVALMDPLGSAPLGPLSGGYNMMWPKLTASQMNVIQIISYGQDGSFPGTMESACNPTLWVCFNAIDKTTLSVPIYFGRFPVTDPKTNFAAFDQTQYQWYTCAGYSEYWPAAGSVCDFNNAANRTSTLANATAIMHAPDFAAWPGERQVMTFLSDFGSYLLPGLTRAAEGTHISWSWAPHPWGPVYVAGQSECTEGVTAVCGPGFNVVTPYQSALVSSNPLAVKLRYTSDTFFHGGGGNPVFGQFTAINGRAPANGLTRKADFAGPAQLGMAHHLAAGPIGASYSSTAGPRAGGIPIAGNSPSAYNPTVFCKIVTTSSTMVSGAIDLPNYPLAVILTDAALKVTTNGGLVNSNLGYDIRFFSDCSGSGSQLTWEMDSYNPTTGAIVAHVLRPTLSHTANDTIGMYYGGNFTTFQSTASSTWNANYVAVFHMSTTSGNAFSGLDSTTNANNLTVGSLVTQTTGQLGLGSAFTGADTNNTNRSMVNVSPTGIPVTTAVRTLEGWYKLASAKTEVMFGWGSSGTATSQYQLMYNSDNKITLNITGTGTANIATIPWTFDTNWHHIAATLPSGTTTSSILMYLDGVAGTVTAGGATLATALGDLRIGSNPGYVGGCGPCWNLSGSTDELRISNSARSADWIKTEFRNQSAPGTYITEGSPVTITTIAVTQPKFSLAWWMDGWDHGGVTANPNRPYMRDILSGGSNYFTVEQSNNGGSTYLPGYSNGAALAASGITLAGASNFPYVQPSFTDTVLTGNASWTSVLVVNPTGVSGVAPINFTHTSGSYYPIDMTVGFGIVNSGDVCVEWGAGNDKICTPGATLTAAVWNTIIVTAAANAAGYPTVTIWVGIAGTLTEFGGGNMGLSATGTTVNGLTKTCTTCTSTPSVSTGGTIRIGTAASHFRSYIGTVGEVAMFSGSISTNIATGIYRTLAADWARVSRGTL